MGFFSCSPAPAIIFLWTKLHPDLQIDSVKLKGKSTVNLSETLNSENLKFFRAYAFTTKTAKFTFTTGLLSVPSLALSFIKTKGLLNLHLLNHLLQAAYCRVFYTKTDSKYSKKMKKLISFPVPTRKLKVNDPKLKSPEP